MGLLSGGFGVKTLLKDKSLWRIRLGFVYVMKAFQIITHTKGQSFSALTHTHTHTNVLSSALWMFTGFVVVVVDSGADLHYFITAKQMNMF